MVQLVGQAIRKKTSLRLVVQLVEAGTRNNLMIFGNISRYPDMRMVWVSDDRRVDLNGIFCVSVAYNGSL